MSHKRCHNCKYYSPDWYDHSTCKSPDVVKIKTDEAFIKRIYPRCSSVISDKIEDDCLHFKETLSFKFKRFFGGIQKRYCMKKHPEWFI